MTDERKAGLAHVFDTASDHYREDDADLLEVGADQRNLPPPPRIVFAALVEAEAVDANLAGSWLSRPDVKISFELPAGTQGDGTDLRWVLLAEKPPPPGAVLGHMFKRINRLINANLRYTFG